MPTLADGAGCPQDAPMALHPPSARSWYLAALVFGVLLLPFLVHLTGAFLFGRYAAGDALGFFGDYLRGLATFRWYSWTVALGPLVLLAVWRGAWHLRRARA
jgi:hypothetical protein